ncbi:hypothetical protein MTO96_037659 [Rhipicephalus appendiculatus]
MTTTTSEATIACIHELFCRFAFPETLVSDKGNQFISAELQAYLKQRGIRHVRTAPYHPSSNRLAEHFVQILKLALRKTSPRTASEELAYFLLAYRNTSHVTTGEAPSSLLLGRRLRTRLDLIRPAVENRVLQPQFDPTRCHPCRDNVLAVGDAVRARNFRSGPKWLCGTVLARTGPVSYHLRVVTPLAVLQWVRHQNHIRNDNTDITAEFDLPFGGRWQEFPAQVPATDSSNDVDSPPIARSEPADTSNAASERRYPQRQRRAPDRFVP